MERSAFKMKLKPGFEAEYKKRHDEIWPELSERLSASGIYDYSIYLDEESLSLFATLKLKEGHKSDELPQAEEIKKWWAFMADIMDTHEDNSPVCVRLEEMFHMD